MQVNSHCGIFFQKLGAFVATRWNSLSVRLTAFTLVVCVGSWLVVTLLNLYVLRSDMRELIGNQQIDSVSMMAAEIDQDLQARFDELSSIAKDIQGTPSTGASVLQAQLEHHPDLLDLFNFGAFITDAKGVTLASVPRTANRLGVSYSDRDFFQISMHSGRATVGKPVVGRVSKRAVLVLSVPIRNAAGAVVGIFAGVTTLEQPSFLDRVAANKFGSSGGYVLIDKGSRTVITATDTRRIMETLPPPGVNPTLDRHMEGGEGVDLAVNPRGIETVSATKQLRTAPWYLVANWPTTEAFAPIRRLENQILTMGVLAVLIVALLVWWNIRRHIAPLLRTAVILEKVAKTGEPMRALQVVRKDEIGALTLAFNRLLAHLQQKEKEVEQLAMFDQLTLLPNRRLFLDRLHQAMSHSARQGCHAALLFLDMDRFKTLNDTHGHSAGDALLCEVAQRLVSCVRAADTVARLGGDEFVVIFNDLAVYAEDALRQAQAMAESLRTSLAQPYVLKVTESNLNAKTVLFESSASIGVCVFSGTRASDSKLIQLADEAMYGVKKSGRNAVHVLLHQDTQ
jgi:diguanylate cyclase (GGDEF)-like protein